ncbi:hypothetical protein PM082_020908 [Marasmius tenuissimus]|nr:hypothetical protein PM082_015455 [Marasmius tenuissimus]KAJ8091673.1 hypothetical protein PM082_020908 [Marasmius tenuissimus]
MILMILLLPPPPFLFTIDDCDLHSVYMYLSSNHSTSFLVFGWRTAGIDSHGGTEIGHGKKAGKGVLSWSPTHRRTAQNTQEHKLCPSFAPRSSKSKSNPPYLILSKEHEHDTRELEKIHTARTTTTSRSQLCEREIFSSRNHGQFMYITFGLKPTSHRPGVLSSTLQHQAKRDSLLFHSYLRCNLIYRHRISSVAGIGIRTGVSPLPSL